MEVKVTELDVCLSRLDKRTNDLNLQQMADAYAEVRMLRKIASDYDAKEQEVVYWKDAAETFCAEMERLTKERDEAQTDSVNEGENNRRLAQSILAERKAIASRLNEIANTSWFPLLRVVAESVERGEFAK